MKSVWLHPVHLNQPKEKISTTSTLPLDEFCFDSNCPTAGIAIVHPCLKVVLRRVYGVSISKQLLFPEKFPPVSGMFPPASACFQLFAPLTLTSQAFCPASGAVQRYRPDPAVLMLAVLVSLLSE